MGVVPLGTPGQFISHRTSIVLYALLIWIAPFSFASGALAGQLELKKSYWIVFASRSELSEAVTAVATLKRHQVIIRSESGMYAVAMGPFKETVSIEELRKKYGIPPDSFRTRGKSFETIVWPVCKDCFVHVAAADWIGADGHAHTAAAVGYGDSYDEAAKEALHACNAKGRNCKVATVGSWNGKCLYASLGTSQNSAVWGTGETREAAIDSCYSLATDCGAPIGGCSRKFTD